MLLGLVNWVTRLIWSLHKVILQTRGPGQTTLDVVYTMYLIIPSRKARWSLRIHMIQAWRLFHGHSVIGSGCWSLSFFVVPKIIPACQPAASWVEITKVPIESALISGGKQVDMASHPVGKGSCPHMCIYNGAIRYFTHWTWVSTHWVRIMSLHVYKHWWNSGLNSKAMTCCQVEVWVMSLYVDMQWWIFVFDSGTMVSRPGGENHVLRFAGIHDLDPLATIVVG